MTEHDNPDNPNLSPETIKTGLSDLLSLAETQPGEKISVDPFTMSISSQSPDELTPEDETFFTQVILFEFGLAAPKECEQNFVGKSTENAPPESKSPGPIKILTYKTSRPGVLFRDLTYSDDERGMEIVYNEPQ